MISFEDLLLARDAVVQQILAVLSMDEIVYALKGASPEMQKKVLRNMSTQAALHCEAAMREKGAVPITEVEHAQQRFLAVYAQYGNS